ncbi:MAG: rod shape-determining protein MreD [Sphingomonadales bacterium]|nr:rod shape-determining protein MreD [Sphingomonadales bacterium]
MAGLLPELGLQRRLDARFRKRINRAPSPLLAHGAPWLTVMLGSLAAGWLAIARTPVMPPLGYLVLIGWRQLRPGVLPVWAGLPLGLADDLVSGQPAGSAVLLWSLTLLGLEAIEARWPWRNFGIEWAVAAGLIALYLLGAAMLASGTARIDWLPGVLVQIVVSVLAYPPAARAVAAFDRLRLARFRNLG